MDNQFDFSTNQITVNNLKNIGLCLHASDLEGPSKIVIHNRELYLNIERRKHAEGMYHYIKIANAIFGKIEQFLNYTTAVSIYSRDSDYCTVIYFTPVMFL